MTSFVYSKSFFSKMSVLDFTNPLDSSEEMNLLIDTLRLYNCRAIEILRARKCNIWNNQFILLKGAKGSQDVVIRDRELVNRFVSLASSRQDRLFIFTTYQKLYHYIKKHFSHIITRIKAEKNNKVTHAWRYLNVDQMTDEATIKTLLHHNSTRSNKNYKNKIGVM